uniref:Uncharacterized protein n=2 Tax=Ovis aries TaxID=9940 RepID=A0AC11D8R4_SHEEP
GHSRPLKTCPSRPPKSVSLTNRDERPSTLPPNNQVAENLLTPVLLSEAFEPPDSALGAGLGLVRDAEPLSAVHSRAFVHRVPERLRSRLCSGAKDARGASPPALPSSPDRSGSRGSTCGAMMLPLSTIEGQETEEVQTRPPEKGALLSENPDEPRKKPRGMKGRLSFNVLPFCPMPSVCFTYYVEPDDPEPEPQVAPDASKSDPNCSFVPLPVLEFREVKVCECPLCCLSFVTAS